MKKALQRYWLAYLLLIVGIVCQGLGLASATIWRPANHVTLNLPEKMSAPAGQSQLFMTRPGLLGLYETPAQIQVSGPGEIKAGIANGHDLLGIFSSQNFVEITGQKDINHFIIREHKSPSGSAATLPKSLTDLQVWEEESHQSTIKTTWNKNREADWSLYVWTDKAPVKIQITWARPVSTPWKWPLYTLGIIMLVLACIVFGFIYAVDKAARKEAAEYERRRAERKAAVANQPALVAPSVTSVAKPPSRRELREARERGETTVDIDGVKFPTGLTQIIKLDADGNPIKPEPDSSATDLVNEETTSIIATTSSDTTAEETSATVTSPVSHHVDTVLSLEELTAQYPVSEAENAEDELDPAQTLVPYLNETSEDLALKKKRAEEDAEFEAEMAAILATDDSDPELPNEQHFSLTRALINQANPQVLQEKAAAQKAALEALDAALLQKYPLVENTAEAPEAVVDPATTLLFPENDPGDAQKSNQQ